MNTRPPEARIESTVDQRIDNTGLRIPTAKGSTIIGLLITIAVLAILTAASALMLVSCFRLN